MKRARVKLLDESLKSPRLELAGLEKFEGVIDKSIDVKDTARPVIAIQLRLLSGQLSYLTPG